MRTKAFISALVAGALMQSLAVPPMLEANLWSERRMAARRQRGALDRMGKALVAPLPAGASTGGIALPLQPMVPISLKPLTSSVGKNLPKNFLRQHESLLNALPVACGSVRKVTQPLVGQRTSKIVIHIQDVHQNEAAQRKIGYAIEALVEKGQAGRIALEGAWGPIQINGLRQFSRPDLLRTVADYLLRVHKISGPVHSAITGGQTFPPIIGVDDPAHYRANVAAYQRAAPRQTKIQESLKGIQADLDRRWETALNPPLLSFVKLTQSFHKEDISLGSYVHALLPPVEKKGVGPTLRSFLDALELERSMDFKQVEREREKLLEGLVQRMEPSALEKLAQKSTAYRLGEIRYADFYGALQILCVKNGMDLHRYPGMEAYIRYILTADTIDPELLLTELRALEDSIRERLIKTPAENRLVEEGTVLGLAKKLADFSLTTEEWNQYQSLRGESLSQYKLDLQDFEAFYREAQSRDAAMAENVLREMETNPSQPVVLVTGGFHSSGLADRLIRAGVTVVSFTPRIDKIDTAQGSAYLSVFSQEKTPLESLFQGQKLFLATPPADTGNIPFLVAATAAAEQPDPASMSKNFAKFYEEAARLLGFQNIRQILPKIEIKRSPDGNKNITVRWKNKTYGVSFTRGKLSGFRPVTETSDGPGAFVKRWVLKVIRRYFPREITEHENELPRVDLTETGGLGFAKERLISAFKETRNKLIAQGRPNGKPYFPYLYESKEREFAVEADGIKIALVDVAERADYDKPRRLSVFARHPRNIREGHPDDKCVFCRLMRNNSQEFFARIQGTGGNIYRATVNLGEYGYPHFQFISEDSVPNLYDRNNRFLDFLLSARALGPDYGVMINGPFSGASQRHLHWHAIKIKPGGLWAYIDSLSPPTESGPSMREELANYPGRPILFRGSSLEELNEKITKEIIALYDDQISAGIHARVRKDGTFEVVVAPTRGEAMVAFDVILHGSDEEFEKHRTAVRNYNLFGIEDSSFDPIAEGMGATHTPGAVPNILMEIPKEFKTNNEWQAQTAKRLIQVFGDYNPKKDVDRAVARFNQILEAAWGSETPTEVPGAKQLLSALSDSNIPLYIASGAPEEIIERGLDALKMDQIPPENRFGAPRPKSETIAQAKQRTDGVVIMFGDGELDMTEAKKVEGVIGIQRKDSTSSHPTFNSANYVVADYSQVEWKALDGTFSFPDQKSGQRVNLSGVGAVVFDFDGTLVASEGLVGGVYARFVREYFGLPDNDTTAGQIAVDVWRSMDGRPAEEILPVIISTLKERGSGRPSLAQTPYTKSVWKIIARWFRISPNSIYFNQKEFGFTVFWEFASHWAAPFFIVSWLLARGGLPIPDMWLIPLLAPILERAFIRSHSPLDQGKDLFWLAHFLMAFYGSGGVLIAWGGWGIVVGVGLILIGLGIHYHHDISRAPPSSSDEGQGQNTASETMAPETALRSILNLPEPVDAKLRSATARFTFLASFDEMAVRDHAAVTSKGSLLSMLDAYAKEGEEWTGDLGQLVQEENAGVWVVPVGADRKGVGAMARACLSSRGRDTEIRFVAENAVVAFALRLWSFGRSRVQVQTVPGAFSLGSGNRRVFRLVVAQGALARDMSLRSGIAWRIVAPESIALDYSGLNENSPLWNASVIFLDALLRTLPVPASSLRNLDNAATRLIKRMA